MEELDQQQNTIPEKEQESLIKGNGKELKHLIELEVVDTRWTKQYVYDEKWKSIINTLWAYNKSTMSTVIINASSLLLRLMCAS